MNPKLTDTVQPWYRHPWPWILMLGPFIVVVAGFVTAYLAASSNDGLVDDDYYKQGLAINQVTDRTKRAKELGVRAELTVDAQRQLVRVALSNTASVFPKTLRLNIAHPTRSGLDQNLSLHADGLGTYSAGLGQPLTGRWHIVLEDDQREWRLSDEWVIENQALLILPTAESGAIR
jgi:hypothetical protein